MMAAFLAESPMSAHQIDWRCLDAETAAHVGRGDLVSVDAGGLPIFEVMSLENGRAWLRDIDSGADRVTPLAAFHWTASRG
jgi:hypothetical protein